MLRYRLIHPTLLSVLAGAGHGSRVLIADGHYPYSTGSHPAAEIVHLNLSPDRLLVTEVLDAVLDAVPVEAATVMTPPPELPEPAVFAEFRAALPTVSLQGVDRYAFYDAAREPNVALVVATGDQRTYANLLLTMGVRGRSEDDDPTRAA